MECYRRIDDLRYVETVERGFSYYDAEYFRRGRVADDMLTFFADCRSQACRPLFECTRRANLERATADYPCHVHDRIIDRGFYDDIERHPGAHTTGTRGRR